MNKELWSFFLLFIALLTGALYYTNNIQSPIISSLNFVKSSYHYTIETIEFTVDKHFSQADTIVELKEKLNTYENNHLVMQQMASEINDLFSLNNSKLNLDAKVELVRTISYKKFGNLNHLWLDVDDYNSSKIYGLTYNEYVAGIVINEDSKPLALLNRDYKSSYAVYVSNYDAPGIVSGNNGEHLIAKFIPTWFKIEVGDEVITSGLDNIFYKGLKVGKVLSVETSQGYQNAIIEPYYKSNNPSYFYMIKSTK